VCVRGRAVCVVCVCVWSVWVRVCGVVCVCVVWSVWVQCVWCVSVGEGVGELSSRN
jgi:hypothetical protein